MSAEHSATAGVVQGILAEARAKIRKAKRAPKHCKRCGGLHAGGCALVETFYGTRCRPELVELCERRERQKRGAA